MKFTRKLFATQPNNKVNSNVKNSKKKEKMMLKQGKKSNEMYENKTRKYFVLKKKN